MSAIQYDRRDDGIVVLTMDMPGQSANTMNQDFRDAFGQCVDRLLADKANITGVILASAKSTFFAGGDLKELVAVQPADAERFMTMLTNQITTPLRQLETLGKPVVAAINGAALGGGWELALACHGRIAVSSSAYRLGLPEVTLGLLPGGGGCTRLPRLLGIEKALPLLIEGQQLTVDKALSLGLLNATVDSADQLIDAAVSWISAHPQAKQPWDEKGYKMPGGSPDNPKVAQMLAIAPAMLKAKTKGCYPAPEAILSTVVEGAKVDFETAQRIESRYFTHLVTSQVAKNMIGTFWFQLNAIKAGKSRPQLDMGVNGGKSFEITKVGVLGAGMMGAGIAYATATKGIQTVLKDVSQEQADKGKAYTQNLLDKKLQRKRISAEKRDQQLALIESTVSVEALKDCDLIIEAVFEDGDLKARVTRESEPMLATGGVFATNTSTIPISQLASASEQPADFIGLHFFSPVDKMQLVEIIKGQKTSDETLAKAFDFVLQIGKIPIVVNDSRGFFTSRVFGTFVNEGITMLGEGIHPASIENAALLAGMPIGPLAISDEVSLKLMRHIRRQTEADIKAAGGTYQKHPAEAVIDVMVDEFERTGKAGGGGFYDYQVKLPNGSLGKQLWSGLADRWTDDALTRATDLQTLKDRFLYIQALETVRCLDEGVLHSVADANIGSIFGIGFAPWTGGALQFINHTGLTKFVSRSQSLKTDFGDRFDPPASLISMADTGKQYR
ncbi:3-hydroxyacyl-CoA dehydrogenase NAD-binding domain-containing protein [Allohahella marinimesophila]|uniref:3-hydroxyacyl-CoA dehydrogenase NAD-binding domain-containing protein n=1 Tax=Allohahella marinimesophila TaxID=1054972 RepID=A0ABP7NSR7_9GAMM